MLEKEIKLNAYIEVEALCKGFKIAVERDIDGEQVIPQISGLIHLIEKLAESGFTPTSGIIYEIQKKNPNKKKLIRRLN